MNRSASLSGNSLEAVQHLKTVREIDTVILRCVDLQGGLVPEVEANLTHD
ncbi:hypothetical protein [Streptomyces goshikiensis]